MITTIPSFTPIETSAFLTLSGRALESRLPNSILHDSTADEIVRKLDYDVAHFKIGMNMMLTIAQRSKKMDEVVERFCEQHPDAVVIDLGVGLDSRLYRVSPPSSVDWYNIDFANIMAVRKQLLPVVPNAHEVASDVTNPNWLDAIPADRPAVIVADGLLAFLSQEDLVALLGRLIDHFPSGEIVFNGYSRFSIWAATHYHGTQSIADLVKSPGFDDAHAPERWNPKLQLVREILLTREPEIAQFPFALRIFTQLSSHSTAWSRKGATVLHYRF